MIKNAYSQRQNLEMLKSQLDNERSSFRSHWQELNDYILPRRGRFYTADVNKGDRRTKNIIDSTATLAARTLRSGMMSGVTSPARPWFRLTTPDADLAEFGRVKEWLTFVERRMSTVFLRSNLYNTLPIIYGDIGVFGTSAMHMEEDFTGAVSQFSAYPIGSYMLANSYRGRVEVFFREFKMTVRQIVEKFLIYDGYKIDWSKASHHVKNLWDNGNTEAWIEVSHVIMPNENYNPKMLESKYKKFRSIYYESGFSNSSGMGNFFTGNDHNLLLRDSGYDYFPVLCPRWEVTGEDVYGTDCPGMAALGDIKQLQYGEKRAAQAIDKMINPPMVAPTHLKNQKTSILPGDITYTDDREGLRGFRPAHEINFNIQALEGKQAQVRDRIRRAFFEDLFLMLASSDRRQITAREIEERHEEKLLALGPVLEQLNQDLLDPLIDNTFSMMSSQGLLPPPPEELQGQELKVEYVSIMAQAQKLVGISSVERFTGYAGGLLQASPEVLDKVDMDQLVDIYGDLVSLPPGIIRSDEDVQAIRDQRAQAQAAQAQQEQAMQQASVAKQLSETDTGGENALTEILGGVPGGGI